MRNILLAAFVAAAMIPAAANARTYKITITDTSRDQTNFLGEPFIPHYGYTGGPVQSWGFGKNLVTGTGWLDFFEDGSSLIHEATAHGNDFFKTTTPFYAVNDGQLSFLAQPNTGPHFYAIEGGGTLSVAALPEPSVWAMMILGLGAVGVGLRNRKRATPALA